MSTKTKSKSSHTIKKIGLVDIKTDAGIIRKIDIAYQTWGRLNEKRDNVIWINHGLTADTNAKEWWPNMIGPGKAFNTDLYYIICPNIPGSCYGSSEPHEILLKNNNKNVQLGPKEIAQVFHQIAKKLNFKQIYGLSGASIGGFIALEWAILAKEYIRNLFLVATSYYASPWNKALNETQRMALDNNNETEGLAAARAIALLSYRTPQKYNQTQQGFNGDKSSKAASYQRYQGLKLTQRFSIESYRFLLNFFDLHNAAQDEKNIWDVMSEITANTLVISITSDLLFPTEEQLYLHQLIDRSKLVTIRSDYGHDAFLVETKEISKAIQSFFIQSKTSKHDK
ncbi:MAG: homoserine O-acetyltransferase [Salinivirgaceae bacterium]|nr:MAG: homoserine O-acetyltransferase [Salinivirgaceae bacterium]